MKKTILSILIILLMASNAIAQESCGTTTSSTGSWSPAWLLVSFTAAYAAIPHVAPYASTTTDLSDSWAVTEIGNPDCVQDYGHGFGDFGMKYQASFDSATPDYEKAFFDETTETITMVAAFNSISSVSVVSLDFNTKEFVFKNNYAWDGDITFTGAAYDSSTGYTTISANTQNVGEDVQIIFTINNVGAEVYTTQIGITGENMESGCINYVNGNLVTCTLVNGYSGVTTINPGTGAAISTVVIPITVNPPTPQPYCTIDDVFVMPHADPLSAKQNVYNFGIASNGAITPTAGEYESEDVTWDSINSIEILSESTTAITGMTTTGLSTYPTLSVYDTDTNTQIFAYQIQNTNAVIAGVTLTEDGNIAVAATDASADETSLYIFDAEGNLLNFGKISEFSAKDMETIEFTLVSPVKENVILVGVYNTVSKPKSMLVDLTDFSIPTVITQDVTASIDGVIKTNNMEVYQIMPTSGSFGIQIYGITPNPDVPEFSITTLLLAMLLAGGLVLFVVRRRK